jgi:hypothetical protein
MSDLPRTFRDAVEATRELGVEFLWIDSLCILQDSVDDWDIESNRMHDVYRYSYLTRPGDLKSPGSCCELAPREAVSGL